MYWACLNFSSRTGATDRPVFWYKIKYIVELRKTIQQNCMRIRNLVFFNNFYFFLLFYLLMEEVCVWGMSWCSKCEINYASEGNMFLGNWVEILLIIIFQLERNLKVIKHWKCSNYFKIMVVGNNASGKVE